MPRERWREIEHAYNAVISRPERERAEALSELCQSDDALQKEVESLLAHEGAANAFLETPAFASVSIRQEPTFVGRRFGPYSILALLGAGGMGEVYRAHDEQLGRDVAIKILPRHFSSNPGRLARFENEARMLAALNHPHIGAIYGHEKVDGDLALVLELVEGETLAEYVARHAGSTSPAVAGDGARPGLAVQDALMIAGQIAEALTAAHKRGIVHRDLKPANIKITPDGIVKVLDFGLAKLGAEGDGVSGGPPLTSPSAAGRTRDGAILGTVAYMSPEQAAGGAADKRSDLWSFGVVLLEMLTGRPVFGGKTESDVLAALRTTEPDWSRLPADTPAPVRNLLRGCLERDPARRLDSAAAARLEIDKVYAPLSAGLPMGGETRLRTLSRRAVIALVAASAIGIPMLRVVKPARKLADRTRIPIVPPLTEALNSSGGLDRDLAISPDGQILVYRSGGTQTAGSLLMRRTLNDGGARPLERIANADTPFFSPDGQSIGFFEHSYLKTVSIAGGNSTSLCKVKGDSRGASWGDKTIVFATGDLGTGLWRVPEDGGEKTRLTEPNVALGEQHVFPSFVPGTNVVLFTVTRSGSKAQVAARNLTTGKQQMIADEGSQPEDVAHPTGSNPPGYVVYAAEGSLRAVGFDPDRLETVGKPVVVGPNVAMKSSGAANYAVSREGTLAHVLPNDGPKRSLVWVSSNGVEEPIFSAPERAFGHIRLSPDNKRVVATIDDRGNKDIYVWDFAQEMLTPVIQNPGDDGMPLWTPDGRIIFMSERKQAGVQQLYITDADGSEACPITADANQYWPVSIASKEGHVLLFGFGRVDGAMDTSVIQFEMPKSLGRNAECAATPLIEPTELYVGNFPALCPTAPYLAYRAKDDQGRWVINTRRYPDLDGKFSQISIGGTATGPLWAHDGKELFYVDQESGALTAVAVDTSGPTLIPGRHRTVFKTLYAAQDSNPSRFFDLADDGRFLMLKDAPGDRSVSPISMWYVRNWDEELGQLVR